MEKTIFTKKFEVTASVTISDDKAGNFYLTTARSEFNGEIKSCAVPIGLSGLRMLCDNIELVLKGDLDKTSSSEKTIFTKKFAGTASVITVSSCSVFSFYLTTARSEFNGEIKSCAVPIGLSGLRMLCDNIELVLKGDPDKTSYSDMYVHGDPIPTKQVIRICTEDQQQPHNLKKP